MKSKKLCMEKLKKANENVWMRFNKLNEPYTEDFTFVFPEEFKYYYTSFDILLYELSIFLEKIGCPFRKLFDVERYYNNLFNIEHGGRIKFDLSNTSYIGELEMLMIHILGSFCQKITKQAVVVELNKEKIGLLRSWNFFEHFWDWGELTPELEKTRFFGSRLDSEVLIPIRKISNYSDVGSTLGNLEVTKIKYMLEREYGMDGDLIDTFVTDVISEICNNIPQHSESEGYILVHAHPEHPEHDEKAIPNIEIAISDGGIGIKQTLYNRYPNRYKNKKHYEAIEDVLKGQFPYPKYEKHGGILRARTFVDRFGGIIFIRSICGKAGNQGYTSDFDKNWRFFPGTHVNMLIPRITLKNKKGGNRVE